MTAFMPAGCEHLLPSIILALVIELGLQGISGAVSPIDMIRWVVMALRPGIWGGRSEERRVGKECA